MTRPPPRNSTTVPTEDEHPSVTVAPSGPRPAYPLDHVGSTSKAYRASQSTVPVPISNATTVDFDDLKAEALVQNRAPKKSKRIRWLDARDEAFGHVATLYRKVVVEGILRQKPLPPSADGRHIPLSTSRKRSDLLIDERTRKPYVDNFIRSSRYTIWDFLPKQLFFQFSKLGNAYFLAISIMQLTPGLSTTGTWTTFAPLMAFVALSMAKEGYDDYRRYRLDKADNRSEVQIWGEDLNALRRAKKKVAKKANEGAELAMDDLGDDAALEKDGPWSTILWQDVKVGDIVRLRRDENVPADIVVLHASNPNSVTYIETMALDGETNLKAKRASPILAARCATRAGLEACDDDAVVVSEDPNVDLYRYDGRVTVAGETVPLSLANVVYRGSTVRNTAETIGLVVNTGEECKIRMNAHKHVTTKAPAMQYVVNGCIVWLVFVLLGISGGLTGGYFLHRDTVETRSWFLGGTSLSFREVFIAYIIMFNTLIPLSLYISLEIIKVIQFYLMGDVEMYDPVTNTPMVANTTTILEDLGQVNYVFSDKTGTLTENVMRFRKMSVAGTAWLHDMDVERDEEAKQKLIAMARKKRKGKGKDRDKNKDKDQDKNKDTRPEPDDNNNNNNNVAPPASPLVRWEGTGANENSPAERDPELKTEDLLDYLRRRPNTTFARKAKFFLLAIALCHTCLPEEGPKGEIEYQAASPDEQALVEAARDLGYILVDRPNQQIILQLPNPDGSTTRETYEVLDVIDFTSKRKRMSIIIRMPDGRICVFCKGADSIILPRLKLSHLAMQKVSAVEAMADKRRSMEQEKQRISMSSPRNSMALGRSSMSKRRSQFGVKDGAGAFRLSMEGSGQKRMSTTIAGAGAETWRAWSALDDVPGGGSSSNNRPEEAEVRRESERLLAAPSPMQTPRASFAGPSPRVSMALSTHEDVVDGLVDESAAMNEGAMFERCFQHIDDFARDGLRTLLYGYRYLEEDEYARWRKIYSDASTSIENRQEKMEAAGELIEEKFDLAGATAIEDKLQEGVPDTIDKLRRAGIKVWMLTGDKRETAINIAHSARLCQSFSEVIILDSSTGRLEETITSTLSDVCRDMYPHIVVVVDGHTLGVIDDDGGRLSDLFYDLASRVDSLICCRASPAQKANLVKRIRRQVHNSLTLAIGDGANDIGMIQASHVGVGISGREGLQAARISDYSIAQFRFLQRLLFVHGRYNYIRTGKYILATFWKEVVFFLPQAHFQRFNAYSGTSLYENWSLTVFNTLFTSLAVIFLGGFEKDLSPKTLLEHPELYRYGHSNGAINVRLYVGWTLLGIAESFIIYYLTLGVYDKLPFDQDTSLYAMGTVPFTVCVVFINLKLLVLEMHDKTIIAFLGVFLSITGWFLWNLALSGTFSNELRIYQIRRAFLDNFGATLNFWAVCFVALGAVLVLELFVNAFRRVYWANDVDLMQRIEREERKAAKRKAAGGKGVGFDDAQGEEDGRGADAMRGGGVVFEVTGPSGPAPAMAGRPSVDKELTVVRTSQHRLRRSSDFPEVVPEDGSDPFEAGFGKAHTSRHKKLPPVTTRWATSGGDAVEESPIELGTPRGDGRIGQTL